MFAAHDINVAGYQMPSQSVVEALADDLNSGRLFVELHALAKHRKFNELLGSLQLIGFSGKGESIGFAFGTGTAYGRAYAQGVGLAIRPEVDQLIDARNAARASKNWAESDRIRDELAAMGIALKDNKDGTTSWEVKR